MTTDRRGCGGRFATSRRFAATGPFGAWPVWRIVCPPAAGGELGRDVARLTGGEVVYDWGGGLIWVPVPPDGDAQTQAEAHAVLIRGRCEAVGGHATLIRAPEQLRETVDVFHPAPDDVAALTRRIKHSFDPRDILNPGRMGRGTTP